MKKIDTTELVKQVMNEIEQDKLIAFAADPILLNAVKKFVLFSAFHQGVAEPGKPFKADYNWALQMAFGAINPGGMPRSDAELGGDLRAWVKGVNMVESGFAELEGLKKEEPVKEEAGNIAE